MTNIKKKIILVIKIIVTFFLLYIASFNINILDIKKSLTNLNFLFISFAIFFSAIGYIFGGLRWWVINNSLTLHSSVILNIKLFFISGFFSQFVVGGGYGGDVYRAWFLSKLTHRRLDSISSVLIDRISGVLAALITISISLPIYFHLDTTFGSNLVFIALACVGILVVIYLSLKFNEFILSTIIGKKYINESLRNTLDNFVDIFLKYKESFPHLFLSFIGLMCYMLSLYFIYLSLGVYVEIIYLFLLWPIIFIIKSFPLAIGGWGARELAMVYFLGIIGIANQDALLASVLVGLVMIASSSIGFLIWILAPPELDKS